MNRATASVEFALAGPVVVALLVGGIAAALALWATTTLHGVAAAAARCGALGSAGAPACASAAATRARAVADATAWLSPFVTVDAAAVTVNAGATTCGTASGAFYTVSITATLPATAGIPFGGRPLTVGACFPRAGD